MRTGWIWPGTHGALLPQVAGSLVNFNEVHTYCVEDTASCALGCISSLALLVLLRAFTSGNCPIDKGRCLSYFSIKADQDRFTACNFISSSRNLIV